MGHNPLPRSQMKLAWCLVENQNKRRCNIHLIPMAQSFCSQWTHSKGKFKDWNKVPLVQSKHIRNHFTQILQMLENTRGLVMGAHILASIEISPQYKKAKERPTHGALPIQQEVVEESQMLLINMNIVLQYYYLVHMDWEERLSTIVNLIDVFGKAK